MASRRSNQIFQPIAKAASLWPRWIRPYNRLPQSVLRSLNKSVPGSVSFKIENNRPLEFLQKRSIIQLGVCGGAIGSFPNDLFHRSKAGLTKNITINVLLAFEADKRG
jgi:hypothetical protein